jgi:G3E family GTPase
MTPIPVHIITGFLGAGKTTAILEILRREGPGRRTAVLVNEWGKVSLDGPIVASEHPGLEIREISGGCICCSAGAELERVLARISERIGPDRILVEPSGIAKPGEIVDLIRPRLADGALEIRPVVCLVDAARFVKTRAMELPVYRDQVESAQVLVANRCDLADPGTLGAFHEAASRLFPPKMAVYTTSFGKLPPEVLEMPAVRPAATIPDPARDAPGFKEAGWTWPPEKVFCESRLSSLFRNAAGTETHIERAKGVFHTDRGWLLLEIAGGAFHRRPTQYRAMSRCQFIAEARHQAEFGALKHAVDACGSAMRSSPRAAAQPDPEPNPTDRKGG